MSRFALELLSEIESHLDRWVIIRTPNYYDRFLDLLLEVQYPHIDPSQLYGWRLRSCAAWSKQDELLPGNCSGGVQESAIVSTLGALPISNTILYVHSGAMQRSLRGAAGLFANALHTIELLQRFPELKWWMGLYTYRSRFVTTWQRPESFTIPDQLEFEEVRVYPLRLIEPAAPCLRYVPSPSEGVSLRPVHRFFAKLLGEMDMRSGFDYRVQEGTIVDGDGQPLCLALIPDFHEEMTALNVPSWIWIFPSVDSSVDPSLVDSLLSVPELRGRALRIVIDKQEEVPTWESPDYRLVPAFIAMTPRDRLGDLRRSLKEAFMSPLSKYSDEDLMSLARSNDHSGQFVEEEIGR